MPFATNISGTPISVIWDSLKIDDRIGERSTAVFIAKDLAGTENYYKGSGISITDDDGALCFAGFVDSADKRIISPITGGFFHTVQGIDMHFLADKIIAAESYENKTVGYIVDDLFDTYLAAEGMTIGEIQEGPTLSTCVINYARVSDALGGLAEAAGFIWYISYDKKLYLVNRETYTAPWTVTGADIKEGSVPTMTHANPLYRNRQYIRGGKALTDLQTEEKKGDSKTRAFPVGYPMGKVPTSIKVNTAAKTIGIKGIDVGKDWYWAKGDPIVYQDSGGSILAATDTLEIKYYGEYEIIVIAEDEDEVAAELAREGAGTGYVDDVSDEPTITDMTAAIDSALAKLVKYTPQGRRFSFTTLRTGLRTGQIVPITQSDFGLNATEMLIEAITVSRINNNMEYAVTAIEGPEQGGWSKLFKALSDRGQNFVSDVSIGSGATVVRFKQFAENWDWTESIAKTVCACPVPSPTLYPSSTLYPC